MGRSDATALSRMISGSDYLWVALASLAAGLINALAGGGSLISFPALTALGLPAVIANVTNTVALAPGYLGATLAQRGICADRANGCGCWFLPRHSGG